MVKETRIIFQVEDIVAFRVQCGKCKNELLINLKDSKIMPESCPLCRCEWLVRNNGIEQPAGLRLLRELRDILYSDASPVTIKLDMDADTSE